MDQYIFEKTLSFPNTTVRIYRPVLTEEERQKRMKAIHKQAANLLKKVT